jgi:hypothetical protein
MKQVIAYLFTGNLMLEAELHRLRRMNPERAQFGGYVDAICDVVAEHWCPGGLVNPTFVNHMTLAKEKQRPNFDRLGRHRSIVTLAKCRP